MSAFDSAFPMKSVRITRKYTKRSPWISSGLLKSSITKMKLLKNKLKCPTNFNVSIYKNYSSLYFKLIRKAKTSYYVTKLNESKNNMKKTWNLLRSVIDKQKNKAMLPEIFVINNHEISNKKEIANKFNEFFARVGDEISSNVPESEQNFTNYLSAPNPQSMYLDPTSPFDIINITSKIKTTK